MFFAGNWYRALRLRDLNFDVIGFVRENPPKIQLTGKANLYQNSIYNFKPHMILYK